MDASIASFPAVWNRQATPNRCASSSTEKVSITDGPYLEAKEHIGGFWILECADMDAALGWGPKAVNACRVPVEVRTFLRIRPDA